MIRIAIFVFLLIMILLAGKFPKFRRSLEVTIVILFLAIGVIIWQDTQERELD